MFERVVQSLRTVRSEIRLPLVARAERRRDLRSHLRDDPGIERAVTLASGWLCRAQDCSLSRDGGVARHFSLVSGWSESYPEITGYIIPTMLSVADIRGEPRLRERARRMVDWLTSIQLPDGGFQAGTIGARPIVPTVFNTGQILMGLAAGVREWGEGYLRPMHRAAQWLVDAQDADGGWRRFQSPERTPGEKTYYTHVAWGLLDAARVDPATPYAESALRNIRWTLGRMHPNGWFEDCCLDTPAAPLTHTIGYTLRGLVEAYRFTKDAELLAQCVRSADGVLTALRSDGFLPGRLDASWRGAVRWSCLTGSLQIALCWLLLYQITGDARYRSAATAVNRFVRRTMHVDGSPDARGGIKGSFPVSGGYGTYEYLAWACKFFIDANLLEQEVTRQ
jgi:hypothetical protein